MTFMRHLPPAAMAAASMSAMRASVNGQHHFRGGGIDAAAVAVGRVMEEVLIDVEVTMLPMMVMTPSLVKAIPNITAADGIDIERLYEEDQDDIDDEEQGAVHAGSSEANCCVLIRIDRAFIKEDAGSGTETELSGSTKAMLPKCFVAVKTSRMAEQKIPARSQTSTRSPEGEASGDSDTTTNSTATTQPGMNATVWGELLHVLIPERSMYKEKVLIALVAANDDAASGGGGRLIGKSFLPTAPLAAQSRRGRHVHLQLELDTSSSNSGGGGGANQRDATSKPSKVMMNVSVVCCASREDQKVLPGGGIDIGDSVDGAQRGRGEEGGGDFQRSSSDNDDGVMASVGADDTMKMQLAIGVRLASPKGPSKPCLDNASMSVEILEGTDADKNTPTTSSDADKVAEVAVKYKSVSGSGTSDIERAMRFLLARNTVMMSAAGTAGEDDAATRSSHRGRRNIDLVSDLASWSRSVKAAGVGGAGIDGDNSHGNTPHEVVSIVGGCSADIFGESSSAGLSDAVVRVRLALNDDGSEGADARAEGDETTATGAAVDGAGVDVPEATMALEELMRHVDTSTTRSAAAGTSGRRLIVHDIRMSTIIAYVKATGGLWRRKHGRRKGASGPAAARDASSSGNQIIGGSQSVLMPFAGLPISLCLRVLRADAEVEMAAASRASPVKVDMAGITRPRALFAMSSLVYDLVRQQRCMRAQQCSLLATQETMLLLSNKAALACESRVEAERDLEYVRALLDEERRHRSKSINDAEQQGSIHDMPPSMMMMLMKKTPTSPQHPSRGSKTSVTAAHESRQIKEGLAYISGLVEVDALRRAAITTFQHLVREQQRSREAHARIVELHAESVDRARLKKKYKELVEAHTQQQRLVSGVDAAERRCERYKSTIVSQERVIGRLESLLAEASGTASANVASGRIEVLEEAKAELEAELKERKESAARAHDEQQAKIGEMQAKASEREAAMAELRRQHEEHLKRSVDDVEGLTSKHQEQVDAIKAEMERMKSEHAEQLESQRRQMEEKLDAASASAAEAAAAAVREAAHTSDESEATAVATKQKEMELEAALAATKKKESEADDALAAAKKREAEADAAVAAAKKREAEAEEAAASAAKAAKQVQSAPAPVAAPAGDDGDLKGKLRDTTAELNAKEEKLRHLMQEKLQLSMKCDKLETKAVSAENALLDATRRFARQNAELKAKLAEKDAALLGGFGAVSKMALNELGGVQPPPEKTDGGFRMPTPPAALASLSR